MAFTGLLVRYYIMGVARYLSNSGCLVPVLCLPYDRVYCKRDPVYLLPVVFEHPVGQWKQITLYLWRYHQHYELGGSCLVRCSMPAALHRRHLPAAC